MESGTESAPVSGKVSHGLRPQPIVTSRRNRQVSEIQSSRMKISSAAPARPLNQALRTILTAGLVAGFLDGMDAVVFIGMISGVPVVRVFQFIASGAIGVTAFHGGWRTAALGVGFHFTIAIGAAAVYYLLSRKLPGLLRTPLLWGPIYGIGVFLFMHFVVVPLSATPKQHPASVAALTNLVFSHIFFVGIPIAVVTRRMTNRNDSA